MHTNESTCWQADANTTFALSNAYSVLEIIEQAQSDMQSKGITPPDQLVVDDKIHRFGKNKSCWYVFHSDGIPAGAFGDWRTGETYTWCMNIGRELTPTEKIENHERMAEMYRKRDTEKARIHQEAKIKANKIWSEATPVTEHPYLTHKDIKANGIKAYKGSLIIPLYNEAGEICSLQYIDADGHKKFMPDGQVKDCYFRIGKPRDFACIAEGFATAASIHEATGYSVIVAFNAGKLVDAAKFVQNKFPDIKIIICADDDYQTEGNPGLTKAKEAAKSVNGYVAIPDFGDNRPNGFKDFNDLYQSHGIDAVKHCLDKITKPRKLPEPLPDMPNVMPFDFQYLPGMARGYTNDIAQRMQCPPDYLAVTVYVMLAAVIGRKLGIRPMKYDDWTVTPNLWAASIGNSGTLKSPAQAAALAPIKKLAADAYERYAKDQADFNAAASLADIKESANKSAARQKLKKDPNADVSELIKPVEIEGTPFLRRYITNNSTYEALGDLLIENPNGLLIESDELIGLLKQLDSNGQEAARAFYLTAADGDKGYTFDRIGRGKALHVSALCISIIGGIQPGVLNQYVRDAVGGGAGADGLLQRFSLMVYPDISKNWEEVDRYPDVSAKDNMYQLIDKLDNLNPFEIGAESDEYCKMPFLHFDNQAQALFYEWRRNLESRLRSGEEHESFVSHLSKYRKLVPSLALINHLCDQGYGAVDEKSLLRAIAYAEYLESHARRVYSFVARPNIDAAKNLLKRLLANKPDKPFTTREIYRKGWTGLETPAKAQSAIDLLVDYYHLFESEIITGGRPTKIYTLNEVKE